MTSPLPVSIKSTKAELFKAYDAMREEYAALKQNELHPTAQAAQKKEENTLLQKTAQVSPATIEQDVVALRKKMNVALDDMLQQLHTAATTAQDLRQAIDVEKRYLEEARQMKLADDTLQVLIAEYDAKKKEFELSRTIAVQRDAEESEKKKKEREREEEEYVYALKLRRRKAEDAYEAEQMKQRAQEDVEREEKQKQLLMREEKVQQQQQEFLQLTQRVEAFPEQQETAVRQAKTELETALRKDFDVEKQLSEQRWKTEKAMFDAKVAGLQEAMTHQTEEVASLKKALEQASQHAQSLATTVVESVSRAKAGGEGTVSEREKAA